MRDAISAELQGAVARVAEIGFTKVEPYAFVKRTFAAATQLSIGTVIDPFIPSERWQTADDAERLADRVNTLQALASTTGPRFGQHNHNWEFANRVDGRPIYELFLDRLSPEVALEIDTF